MFQIRVTDLAEQDIQATYNWWRENRSTEQAQRWFDAIYPAIATLQTMPRRCSHATERELYSGELRQLLFGVAQRVTHRVVFTIEADAVIVLRVRHTSQHHLGEDELQQ